MFDTKILRGNQDDVKNWRPTLFLLLVSLSSWANDNLDLGIPSGEGQLVNRTGYAFLYSEKHEQPLWVSYKLTKAEVQNKVVKRKDNFRLDPVITTGSAILADYKGSGYDRGHLAPAGDMTWSKKAMSESFFLTNMSPQVPALNRGMWRILEEQIRKWALKEQELYIITGPIIRPNYKTIGPNKVTVPQWYYKIIVDYHQPEIKALAFMIPNRKPQKSLQSFAVSIDKLEEVTRLDFLNLLPQRVQEQLESKVNLSQWKLPAAKVGKPKVGKTEVGTGGEYWISKTNKRHNSTCRYYQKSKGRLGSKNEGRACKVCGG